MNMIKVIIAITALLIIIASCSQSSIKPDATFNPPDTGVETTATSELASPTDVSQFPSPSPTEEIPVETAIPSTSTPTIGLRGELFIWMARFEEPLYTSIDLSSNLPVNLDTKVSPTELVSDNKITVGLAFAPYSSKVAYVTKSTESTDLWVSDLKLTGAEHLWKFDREWSEQLEFPPDVRIKWGPSESSLILSSSINKDHIIIYSFLSKQVYEGTGACDQIAALPNSAQITIWCSFDPSSSMQHGYFSLDGNITFTNEKPKQDLGVFEWSPSPDDKKLAYIPKIGNTVIVEDKGSILDIPISLMNEPGDLISQPLLQWSANGEYLLVYGYNQENCPMVEDPVTGDLEKKECWQVVNSSTGKIIWAPNKEINEIQQLSNLPIEQLISSCAGISSNGDWFLLCYQSGAIEEAMIINLVNNNEIINLGSVNFLDLKWVDH